MKDLNQTLLVIEAGQKIEAYDAIHGEGAGQRVCDELIATLSLPESKADVNKAVAAFHGITVDQLINSPNYEKLQIEYGTDAFRPVIELLIESPLKFTKDEVYAMLKAAQE